MASEIERVLEEAAAPLGGSSAVAAVVEQLRLLQGQFLHLQTAQEAVTESMENAARVTPVAKGSSSGASLSTSSSSGGGGFSLPGFLGPGLLLSPLISGVVKLFGGGGGESEAPPLMKFALPPAVNVNAGVSRAAPGTVFGVDSGQGGVPRPVVQSAAPQITVHVQAMDSQSFMDRSGDIARAVRQAMLESNVLSDVVREA